MKTKPLLILFSLMLASITAFAQADKYKAGDKIEYLESPAKDLWEPGVFMYATPDGKQPVIRKKPNEFYKDGAQTAYDWERIRPLNPGTKPQPPVRAAIPERPLITRPPAPQPTLPGEVSPPQRAIPQRSIPGTNQTIRWRGAMLVAAVALAVRLLYVWSTSDVPTARHLIGDAAGYYDWSRRIASGEWIGDRGFYQAPLYPYVLGVWNMLGIQSVPAIRVAQALCGAAACAFNASIDSHFSIARKVSGPYFV